jgi:GntR family transcriptional regulator, phosphonate transport system regulatory protein
MKQCTLTTRPRSSNRAIWADLAIRLREDITSGRFSGHEQLPSENDLADTFGVHRHTIRKVVSALEGEGLLRVQHGSGIYVNREVIEYNIGVRTRFTENIQRQGLTTIGRLLSASREPAPPEIAKALSLPAHEMLIRLELLRHVQEQPLSVATHYLQASRFEDIADVFAQRGSLTESLKEFGVADYTRLETLVCARLPTADEAECLQQSHNVPILEMRSSNITCVGDAFLYSITRMSALRIQLRVAP